MTPSKMYSPVIPDDAVRQADWSRKTAQETESIQRQWRFGFISAQTAQSLVIPVLHESDLTSPQRVTQQAATPRFNKLYIT